jgi:hypothetical protein
MYSPTSHFSWFKEAYGLVDENHNEMEYHFPIDMNFLQSTRNLLLSLYWNWKRHNELFPKLEPLLKSALNLPNLPSLYEIEKNTSLIFTNTHPNEEFPRSLPPNLIEISCMHCSDVRNPLPNVSHHSGCNFKQFFNVLTKFIFRIWRILLQSEMMVLFF